jgi:hypothetical protein
LRCDKIAKEIDQLESAIEKVDDNLDPEKGRAKLQIAARAVPKIARAIEVVDLDIT